ncbi:MAG TPA: hypothetical protein VEG66_03060 [Thermoplasmata archaeon]|nr:hypothetical protein [Thermoplasmata archaeon]HYB78725.1 hypothetical protein [Thermoplasmata archaeon]
MEFEQHDVHLRTGVCPACTKEFAFVEGAAVSSRLGVPPAGTANEADEEGGASGGAREGPECEECGSPLTFRAGHRGSIEATCDECETTTLYVPKPEHPRPDRGRAPRFDEEVPRSRPCRRCGAPLRFSTGEDGLLVGECESCGNRFTLPPRPDRGRGRGFTGPRRYDRGDVRRGPERPRARTFDDRSRARKRRRPRDE